MKKRRLAALFLTMMVFLGGLEVFATEAPEATEGSEEVTVIEEIAETESAKEEKEPSEEKTKKEKVEKIKEEKSEKIKKTEEAEESEEAEEEEEISEEDAKSEEADEEKQPDEEKQSKEEKRSKEEKEIKITKEEIEAKKEERRAKRTDAKAFMKELKEDFGKADNEAKKAILSEIANLKKELKDYSIGIFVRGADVDFEKYDGVEPEIENERTLIPLRAVVEALEAEVLWDEKERKITITNNETEVVLVIGKKEAYINGEEVLLEAAPKLRKDRTLVPLRFLAEAFGNEVLWDEESKTVIIE